MSDALPCICCSQHGALANARLPTQQKCTPGRCMAASAPLPKAHCSCVYCVYRCCSCAAHCGARAASACCCARSAASTAYLTASVLLQAVHKMCACASLPGVGNSHSTAHLSCMSCLHVLLQPVATSSKAQSSGSWAPYSCTSSAPPLPQTTPWHYTCYGGLSLTRGEIVFCPD